MYPVQYSKIQNRWKKSEAKKTEKLTLRENCPNTKLFLVRIFLYLVRVQENADQK